MEKARAWARRSFRSLFGELWSRFLSVARGRGDEKLASDVGRVDQRAEGDPVQATLEVVTNWGSGYVGRITLCNSGPEPTSSWQVRVNLNGASFGWASNATASVSGDEVTFGPIAEWIAVINPADCKMFEFSSNMTAPTELPTLARHLLGDGHHGHLFRYWHGWHLERRVWRTPDGERRRAAGGIGGTGVERWSGGRVDWGTGGASGAPRRTTSSSGSRPSRARGPCHSTRVLPRSAPPRRGWKALRP